MSLFEGLNVATRGLSAAQLAINVTGQNITNAGTEGYARKRVEQAAEWRKDGSFGQIGFGVEVYSINRVRDQFIDRLVNDEFTRYGFYAMKDAAFDRIESIFNEPSETALNSLLNSFWNSWADVANNPESAGARETLRSNTQAMVSQFHYVTTQLRSFKDIINDEIEDRVNTINQITASIHRCNQVITASENTIGNKANDTRDQRDLLLQQLAKLVDVDYFENEQGALTVSTNGQMLVSPAKNHELVMRRTEVTEQDGYQYSRVEIGFDLTGVVFNPKGGELRALMDTRDIDIPRYEEYINDIAKTLITEVNKIHQNGYGLSGLTYIDFFDSDPSKLNAANIDLAAAIKNDINNIAAGTGGVKKTATELKIPESVSHTVGALDAADFSFPPNLYSSYLDYGSVRVFNETTGKPLVAGTDYTVNPATGEITFLSTSTDVDAADEVSISFNYDMSKYMVPQLSAPGDTATLDLVTIDDHYRFIYKGSLEIKDADGNPLQEGKDYDIDYNTAKITFKYSATNAFADPANQISIKFDYHETGYDGPGGHENALAISQLRNKAVMQSDVFGKSTQTMNEFYSGMLGRLGSERNEAAAGLGTRTFALAQLKTRQDEIMGVNLDEEVAALIQYQHTYQASARYLTTINTMLDTLLNM